ncbi:MAG: SurA N-terminal domain-containing protein [Clostridia bacterium]|nr:SurA N-terminal domain-containing protein [Clostridia bacterium]
MKMLSRLLCGVLALALLCGCALAEGAADDVYATVNGETITREEFEICLTNLMAYQSYSGYDVTDPETVAQLSELAMDTLVKLCLMDQKIAELGLSLTDEEKADAAQEGRERWEEDVRNSMTYYGATDADEEAVRAAVLVKVLDELEKRGYTEQSYIDDALESALYDKLEAQMVAGVTIEDSQIAAGYYERVEAQREAIGDDAPFYEYILQMNQMYLMGYSDSYIELYYRPEGYRRITHILLAVDEALLMDYIDLQAAYEEQQSALEEGATLEGAVLTEQELEDARQAVLASVQDEVDEIRQKLAEGVSFAELIPQYSADAGMDSAAEIAAGWEVHMDSAYFPAGYRDAAFSLEEIGAVSEPVVTDEGVYLISYAGDIAGGALPLTEDMADVIRMELMEAAQTQRYNEVLSSWVAAADLTYSDEILTLMGYME